jgi:hypothetical protein
MEDPGDGNEKPPKIVIVTPVIEADNNKSLALPPPNAPQGGATSQQGTSSASTNVAGGLGTGMKQAEGSVVVKNGEIKYHPKSPTTGRMYHGNQYEKATSMVKSGTKLARGATAVSLAVGAAEVYEGYKTDGNTYGYNAQYKTAEVVGGMAGAYVGAESGATVGAAIGVWFGGAGAVPGAVIGGIVGGIIGGVAGSKSGGLIYKNIK